MSAECPPAGVYRPRNPRATPLYRLVEAHYDEVKGQWEERFEGKYGFWRGFVDGVVDRYLDCGLFEAGFARVRCPECAAEFLVACSCKGRGFCPSCGAKRAAVFAAFLRDEVLEQVAHAQWVFTVPRMIRPYFLHHRELLGKLCRAAYETVQELMAAAAIGVEGFRTGTVAVVQTAGETLAVNPHVHALAPRGGWDATGEWGPVSYVDMSVAERLFRHKVLSFLKAEGLLSEERAALLLSWEHHTGFSVDASVRVEPEDGPGLERLARYILRPPVNLARLSFKEGWDEVIQDLKPRRGQPRGEERVDALEYLARAIAHIPEPRLHTLRYMGRYSNVARGRRRKERDPELEPMRDTPSGCEEPENLSAVERRARRRAWANLVRRVFEVDPLICERCGAEMKIISVILDPEVIDAILRHLRRTNNSEARGPPQAGRPPQPSELRPAS